MSELDTGQGPWSPGLTPQTPALWGVPCGDGGRSGSKDISLGEGSCRGCVVQRSPGF